MIESSPDRKKAAFSKQHFIYLRDLLQELVIRDMKLRYKRSVLGIVWSLLNPLAQLLVFNFIFSRLIPLQISNYGIFLFTGLLSWNWFQSSLLAGTGAIVDNRELVKRPGFPSIILPIVSIFTHFIHLLFALPILLIFLLVSGMPLNATILALPVVLAVQFLFTLSLVNILASIHVTFRDTQYLLGILLLLGFYLSPVIYDISLVPTTYQRIYLLNPLAILIEAYRSILIHGELPATFSLLLLNVAVLVFLWFSLNLFQKASYHFVEEL